MRPLSPVLYFRRNILRTLPVLGIIALAVLGVLVVGILAESQIEEPRRDYIEPAKFYARISARKGSLDPNIAAALRRHPDVERVVRVLSTNIRVASLMGSQGRPVYGMPESDLEWYLEQTGMKLSEGRLPKGSRREIAVHSAILKIKELQIGDEIGRDLDPDEWLPGKFQVVGRLEGRIQFSVTTAPAIRPFTGSAEALQIFARQGRMEALDHYLQTYESEYVQVSTMTTLAKRLAEETQFVTPMLLTINGVTIFVLSLAVGLLNQIYFLQRIPEYGILLALGYSVSYLVRRTLIEALALTVTGWLLGLGLAYAASELLRILIFDPKGMTLAPMTIQIAATTVPIPILIGLFSLSTVIRRLVTLDPVSIVERRD